MTTSTGNRLNWNLTCDLIANSSEELIQKSKKIYDEVGTVTDGDATFKTVIKV